MSVLWSELFEGGGVSETKFFSAANTAIPAGSSGTLLTLIPPAGERVILTHLATTTSAESGITVNVAGSPVIASKGLFDNLSTGNNNFNIGIGSNASKTSYSGTLLQVVGGIGETLTVVKDSGTTGNPITYSYVEAS